MGFTFRTSIDSEKAALASFSRQRGKDRQTQRESWILKNLREGEGEHVVTEGGKGGPRIIPQHLLPKIRRQGTKLRNANTGKRHELGLVKEAYRGRSLALLLL